MGNPISELVQARKGGEPAKQGTWVHPHVAIHLAQWCAPTFAVMVSKWVTEWMMKSFQKLKPAETTVGNRPWSQRLTETYKNHRLYIVQNFPAGSFSTYTAIPCELLMIEDELYRHDMPVKYGDLPDGSIGKRWAIDIKESGLTTPIGKAPLFMPHLGPKGITVEVAVFEAVARPDFEEWLNRKYLPEFLPEYFATKFNQLQLAAASAADNACLRLTGKPAQISGPLRHELNLAGGFISASTNDPPKLTD